MTPELISDFESCERRGFYSRDHESNRLHPTEITRRAIYQALTSGREDVGECAGEAVMSICSEYELDLPDTGHLYDVALHHAAIADVVSTWVGRSVGRKWEIPAPVNGWEANCLTDKQRLMRIALVDHMSEERTLAESISWYTVGSVAVLDAPMVILFVCLGNSRNGKRHSAWSRGFLHPRNRQIRFQPKHHKVEGFKDTWIQVWREEHDQISRETWFSAMESDGMFQELTRRVTIDKLEPARRKQVLDIIARKSKQIAGLKSLPDPSYSACHWPRPCPFRRVCFAPVAVTPEQVGFRRR